MTDAIRPPRIIVVGAGAAGLAAAYRMSEAGLDVRVLEEADRPGGVIASVRQGEWLLELGPNSFRGMPAFYDLAAEVVPPGSLLAAPVRKHPRFIFSGTRMHNVPMNPAAFLASPLLTWKAKFRLLREPFLGARPPADESLADFTRRHLGPEFLEKLIGPFVSGVYAGDPEQLSVRAAFPAIHEFAAGGSVVRGAVRKLFSGRAGRPRPGGPRRPSAMVSFREGLSEFPARLAAALGSAVECGVRVRSVEPVRGADGRCRWRVRVGGQRGETAHEADGLVIAVPAWEAARLLGGFLPESKFLAGLPVSPVAVVHVGVSLSSLKFSPRGFGFLAVKNRGIRALGVLFSSAMYPGRAPAGHALLTMFYGGATDTGALALSDDEIRETVRRDLAATMGFSGEMALFRVTRHDRAIPSYPLGHAARAAELVAAVGRSPAPLALAGNHLGGISVPDVIRAGEAAARAVTAAVKPGRVVTGLLTYGEPPDGFWMSHARYLGRLFRGVTRRTGGMPAAVIPYAAARGAWTRARAWRRENYRSPLEAVTAETARRLAWELNARDGARRHEVRSLYEFRAPDLAAALAGMAGDPPSELRLVPMYVADSDFTDGISRRRVAAWERRHGASRPVPRWVSDFRGEALADVMARFVRERLAGEPEAARRKMMLLLAGHGTPDPAPAGVDNGLAATMALYEAIREKLAPEFGAVGIGWLNHSRGGPWTAPSLREAADVAARNGARRIVVFPFGFLADSSESGLDAEIALRDIPGVEVRFLPCLNADPALVRLLADAVLAAARAPV
ncbi:MAG: protoporphyrinogen oxidase [Planctomycetota bacterium]